MHAKIILKCDWSVTELHFTQLLEFSNDLIIG